MFWSIIKQVQLSNYEITKLPIPHPTINNILILFIIFGIVVFSVRKGETSFLDYAQTNQIKGLAILLVVVNHLWVHVSTDRAIPGFGDYAVSLFLMLSGFGLTMALSNRPLSLKYFISRRLRKVMVPYWAITLIILIVDFYVLNRSYSVKHIFETLIGINIDETLWYLDYTRWYISLLLIYYVMFYLANRLLNNYNALVILFIFAILLILLKYLKLFPFGTIDQLIAFPVGCLFAYYKRNISDYVIVQCREPLFYILYIVIVIILSYLLFTMSAYYHTTSYYKVAYAFLQGVGGILFCLSLMIIVGLIGNNYISGFLVLCGTWSYEIYLIHGPILIKYNPILNLFPNNLILISFLIYLFIILGLSYYFNKLNVRLT